MKYKSIRGMDDILGQDIRIWQMIEKKARLNLESYGFEEIRTPIVEDASLFVRGIGETTDIVTKEMYTFKDRKERSLTLRPEGTASIARAYIEHSLDKISPELKLYYIGPMFRSERPQKGRSRQFHQIGAEIIGARSYFADAELIMQLSKMLNVLDVQNFVIKLNSLGCQRDKTNFANSLRVYLKNKQNRLCDDCKERTKRNVLRVLDCKKESCQQVVREAPSILSSLCDTCKNHFDRLKGILRSLKIEFVETKNLVRGLDYYTGTVFEITHSALGGQDAIGAGGRYDNLIKDLGGSDIPAIGYALGIERLIISFTGEKSKTSLPNTIYVATLGEKSKIEGLKLAEAIRSKLCVPVLTDIKGASLKSQFRSADKSEAKFVVIIGEDEIKKGISIIRNMSTKEQIEVSGDKVINELQTRMKG